MGYSPGYSRGNTVATAYFNLPGFDLLAEEFGKVAQLRLRLGAEPRPEPQWPEPQPGEEYRQEPRRALLQRGDEIRQLPWKAGREIFASWTYETDPANLQSEVPKPNRKIAGHLRPHPPPDIERARFTRALEAVESPRSPREQTETRTRSDYRASRSLGS